MRRGALEGKGARFLMGGGGCTFSFNFFPAAGGLHVGDLKSGRGAL